LIKSQDIKIDVTDKYAEMIFNDLDADGNGELDFDEIKDQIAYMITAHNDKYNKFVIIFY
jgi:Ca2+-binding EF-hand superfamily protein